jgi:hypothetical protein
MQHAFASGQKSKPGAAGSVRAASHRSAAPHGMSNHRILQRTCAACAAEKTAMDDETLLQRRTTEGGAGGPPLVDAVLARPGAPLDAHVRDRMENRFNHDFGGVRIHDDALAHESARSVGAAAYTVGSGIVFGPGRYRPETREGGHLLAHELAHTVQQGGLQRRAIDGALAVDPYPALEQEAERAADAAMSAEWVAMPRLSQIGAPMLSREREWKGATSLPEPVIDEEVPSGELGNLTRAYKIKELKLPKEKGSVLSSWEKRATAGALETTIQVTGTVKPILKEERPDRPVLEKYWLQKIGCDRQTLQDRWAEVGGDPDKLFLIKDTTGVCQIDHIVELQFGGNNTKENMQLLDGKDNRDSGTELWQLLAGYARDIKRDVPDLENVVLHFDTVSQVAPLCNACCQAEQKIQDLVVTGKIPKAVDASKEDLATYPISAGGSPTELFVVKLGTGPIKESDPAAAEKIAESDVAKNRSAATLIVGLSLQKLNRSKLPHKIVARFDPENNRLPITVDAAAKSADVPLAVAADGQLSMPVKSPKIAFTYPWLSKGEFTKLKNTPQGLTGEGMIYPTIPFLGPLNVRFAPGELTVTKGLGQKALNPPFPGFRITKGELALELAPEFKPSGIIAFAVGPEKQPVALGEVTAGLEGGNFAVKGTLTAQIPGLDAAVGTVTYVKDVGWNGQIELKTSKIPNTKDVSAVVTLGPDGLKAEGGLTIVLPGEGNTVALHVQQKENHFLLTGKSTLTLPVKGMEPVDVSFEHDGEHIKGSGHTSISFHGLKGDVVITYRDGKVSGKGTIDIKKGPKGRAAGTLAVNLSEQNRISGEGSITYQITDDLVATAGIILGEDESVRLKGALEIVKPIELFPAAEGKKTLLAVPTITIPIPGASIGPVGLVVKIDGGIEIHYQVGPGELRNTKVKAAFNPLDEKPDLDVLFGTQLYVGANAGIGGFVRGALAIDAGIASVSGGLTVGAQADLQGNAQADLKIHYTKSRFEFDAKGMIEAGLALGLTLDADVRAEAGIGPFTASWIKVWHLAAYKLDTGLRFGLEAPLHYDSDKPFKAPSVGDIKWTLPTLGPQMLLDKAMNSATASETKK